MASTTRKSSEYQQVLGGLVSEARMIRLGDSDVNQSVLLTQVFPKLESIVEQAIDVLRDLEQDTAIAGGSSTWSTAGAAVSTETLNELGDLCFMVAAELKGGRDHLHRLSDDSGAFSIFSLLEQTEAKLVEGLCAVESHLARITGLQSTTCHIDLCRNLLRVRQLFGKFRCRVATAEAGRDNPEKALRTVGSSIAWLRGQDDFSKVRASDRLTAKELQQRIVGWLTSEDRRESTGHHIWDEITSFIAIADQINLRQDLVEHDLAIVKQLMELARGLETNSPAAKPLTTLQQSILGRDTLLDGLLMEEILDVDSILTRLSHLRGELQKRSAGTSRDGESARLSSTEAATY